MTALDKLRELSQLFEKAGITNPAKEAETLLTETLNITTVTLHAYTPELDISMSEKLDSLAGRRINGEPMQYVIGHVEFLGLSIHVGKGVLIPRPETELLAEEAVNIIRAQQAAPLRIMDLCTGSGCIALALAKAFPQACVYGVDRWADALHYAGRNAERNKIDNAHFLEGDLFTPLKGYARYNCIISNPPYIRSSDIRGLQREIKDHEPIEALDGGPDGLNFYRRILNEAPAYLEDFGIVILEIGMDQSQDIRDLALLNGFAGIRFVKDYAGIERIFVGSYDSPNRTT